MFKKVIIILLLFQFMAVQIVFAVEEPKNNPLSAALKSAILPGWGQYENGEPLKGYGIRTAMGTSFLLYLIFDQRTKQLQLGSFSQNDKELAAFGRDYSGTGLAAAYLANIADAYVSADNFNHGNQYEKKDPLTALFWSALFPGLGQIYIGDSIFDGTFFALHGAYWLNKGLTGNSTEKSWGLGVFGFYYLIGLCSYFGANAHNQRADKLRSQEKTTFYFQPIIDPARQRLGLCAKYEY